jgi:hypothetical protein
VRLRYVQQTLQHLRSKTSGAFRLDNPTGYEDNALRWICHQASQVGGILHSDMVIGESELGSCQVRAGGNQYALCLRARQELSRELE